MATTGPPPTAEYLREDSRQKLLAVASVFIVIDTFFIGLRFFSRRYEPSKFGANDIFLIIGWINCLGQCAVGLLSVHFGSGYHIQRLILETPELIPDWGRNNLYAYPIIYIWAITWTKLSILLLYLRIFTDKFSRTVCWILVGILAINPVINTVIAIFQCNPREAAWNPLLLHTHCNDIQAHLAYASLINIISDVIMLVIPIPVIYRLQVPTHVKLGVAGTFLLGSLGLFSAIYRFVVFLSIDFSSDGTWYAVPLLNWTIVEAGIYLISACLISSKPIFVKLINSRKISSMYTWARKSQNVTSKGSHGTYNDTTRKTAPFGSRNLDHEAFADGRGHNSSDAFANQGDSYSLDSTTPNKIYVERGFHVSTPGRVS